MKAINYLLFARNLTPYIIIFDFNPLIKGEKKRIAISPRRGKNHNPWDLEVTAAILNLQFLEKRG
jgi:hypothetical protein